MYKDSKPMLNSNELIEHLLTKGVKFNLCSVEEAKQYLTNNNNYFKISAYRKNFSKNADTYIDLDFAMLQDLSVIDMRLRYVLLHMALDIEHFIKVDLLKTIENTTKNGYEIVTDYFDDLRSKENEEIINKVENPIRPYTKLQNELNRNKNNPYCGDLFEKYKDELPVWAFIEIIPFGRLINFYNFCGEKLSCKKITNYYYILLSVKELRNAAAHNNCLINNLSNKNAKHTLDFKIIKDLSEIGIKKEERDNKCGNESIRQIITLFYAHKNLITSSGVRKNRSIELNGAIDRMFRNIDYYSNCLGISTTFNFFKKIVDKWFKIEYNS